MMGTIEVALSFEEFVNIPEGAIDRVERLLERIDTLTGVDPSFFQEIAQDGSVAPRNTVRVRFTMEARRAGLAANGRFRVPGRLRGDPMRRFTAGVARALLSQVGRL